MHMDDIYSQARTSLEQILVGKDELSRKIELRVYDLLSESRRDFNAKKPFNYSGFLPSLYEAIEKKYGSIDDELRLEIEASLNQHMPTPEDGPGYLIGLNYNDCLKDHLVNGNYSSEIAGKNILDDSIDEFFKQVLGRKDKATIIKDDGTIHGTQIYLNKVDVTDLVEDKEDTITSFDLGFAENVNARQFAAITKSYQSPLVLYTMSQTSGHIRRFENGKITFSTNPKEIPQESYLKKAA